MIYRYYLLITIFLTSSIFSQDFSFLGIGFSMNQEEILASLTNSKDLMHAEDQMMKQLIPSTPYTLVLKSNNSNNNMIQRVFVDFYEQKSYQITIFLNPLYFSFYTLSEKMLDFYGIPISRTANQVVWFDSSQEKRATLEFPGTIKFTQMPVLIQVLQRQEKILKEDQNNFIDYKERQRILNEL